MLSRGDFCPFRKSLMELHNAVVGNTHLSTGRSCDNTPSTLLDFRLILDGEIIASGWGGIVMYFELA